jgi:hypothetical protein
VLAFRKGLFDLADHGIFLCVMIYGVLVSFEHVMHGHRELMQQCQLSALRNAAVKHIFPKG